MGKFAVTNHMLRDEIQQILKLLCIPGEDFHEMGKGDWQGIIEKTVETFVCIPHHSCRDHLHWAWNGRLKEPWDAVYLPGQTPHRCLDCIIPDQRVFLLVEDTFDKLWVYDAKSALLSTVIGETTVDEYFVVSKKFSWMLCENHHQVLYAAGEAGVALLAALKTEGEMEQ